MRTRAFPVSLVVVLGCFGCSGDPENDVLPAGSQAVIVGEQSWTLEHPSRPGMIFPQLAPGVRVTIGHDPGVYQETDEDVERHASREDPATAAETRKAGPRLYESGEPMAKLRQVQVTVESGEHEGVSGSVSRHKLRPLPAR